MFSIHRANARMIGGQARMRRTSAGTLTSALQRPSSTPLPACPNIDAKAKATLPIARPLGCTLSTLRRPPSTPACPNIDAKATLRVARPLHCALSTLHGSRTPRRPPSTSAYPNIDAKAKATLPVSSAPAIGLRLSLCHNHHHTFTRRHMSTQSQATLPVSSDPTAKRPTKVCDPYGQSGKPLSRLDAQGLMVTLEEGWILEEAMSEQDHGGNACDDDSKLPNSMMSSNIDSNNDIAQEQQSANASPAAPSSIYREYYHDNFVTGSRFVAQVAAVAHNNNHYPRITLERRLMRREKAWRVVSVVKCFTPTLGGLSYNDFHLAMLVDVETARPEVAELILRGDESLKKHT